MIQLISKEGIATSGKKAFASAVVLAAMGAGLMMTAQPAHAADFTVNSTNDADDGSCSASHCSLREALFQADVNPGPDTVKFNSPGSGVKTIKPTSPLDSVLDDGTTIDGYSQPGSVANTETQPGKTNAQPKIELDGSLAGSPSVAGLRILGDNVTVKGLVINRFSGSGIFIEDTFDNDGISVKVQGNFIGTDPTGTQDLGNGFDGVAVGGLFGDIVGGPLAKDRNLISGNGRDGVLVESYAHTIQGNLIGLKKDGSALGNSGNGVSVGDSDDNFQNRIKQNAISSNGGLGIDLGDDGATANDAGDADEGANELQNKPVIGSAKTGRTSTTIKGSLSSAPNKTFTVEFFSNSAESNDEGKVFVGETSVTTDASGKATFTFKPQGKVPRGQFVTATASDSIGNTSEFSAAKKVVQP
jgi:CSLREA domain-containing protein